MADLKISQLTVGNDAQAGDEIPAARSGGNVKLTGANIAAAATKVGTLADLAVTGAVTLGGDAVVQREAAGVVAQRNGTTAQTFRVYGTESGAGANFERVAFDFATFSGAVYARVQPQTGGTGAANIGLVLGTTGTGAITAQMPDGTTAGGNARGSRAIDLQLSRTAAAQVASGQGSFIAGLNNTASNTNSHAIGLSCTASGVSSFAIGNGAQCTGSQSVALGTFSVASRNAQLAVGSDNNDFGSGGAQWSGSAIKTTTANATPTAMTTQALSNNGAWSFNVLIIARTNTAGGAVAMFERRGCITRGANAASTALVGTIETVGTDKGTNSGSPPSGWDVAIDADTTGGGLRITVTGAAATNIRWVARIDTVETIFA